MFKGINKLWFFYMILAAGLIFASKYIGKNAPQRIGSPDLSTRLLLPEDDCLVRLQPCAAIFSDGALIARLYETNEGSLLRVRQQGLTAEQAAVAEAAVSLPGKIITGKYHEQGAYWSFVLDKTVYDKQSSLKITIASHERWITAFSL